MWLPHLGVFGADWELSDSHQNHPADKDVEEFPTQETGPTTQIQSQGTTRGYLSKIGLQMTPRPILTTTIS